jgi:hypothetical protein
MMFCRKKRLDHAETTPQLQTTQQRNPEMVSD